MDSPSRTAQLHRRIAELELSAKELKRTAKALKESQARYRALFEQAADAIILFDPESISIVEFNEEACRRLGYTRDEFSRLKISDIEVVESLDDVKRHTRQVVKKGSAVFTTKHRTKNGEVLDIEVRSKPVRFGGRLLLMGAWRDITAREKTLKALHESTAILRAISEGTSELICVKDRQGKVLMANPAMLRFLGKTEAEVIGKDDLKYVASAEQAKIIAENDRRIMETGDRETVEETVDAPRGQQTFLFAKSPYRDMDGNVVGIIGVGTDITARKRAEEAVQDSEQRVRSIMENSVDIIYRGNLQTGYYDCVSLSVEKLTGYTLDEFMHFGMRFTLSRIHPDDLAQAKTSFREVLKSPAKQIETQYRYRRKDGAYRWFADNATVIQNAAGTPAYWIGTVRDITDLKRAEEELQQARNELEARVAKRTAELSAANTELLARSTQLARLTSELTIAEQRERRRLAEIIHDDLQQLLFLGRLQTHPLRALAKTPKDVRAVDSLCATMNDAFASARHLVQDLCPPALFLRDLPAATRWLAEDLRKRHKLSVRLQISDALLDLPEPLISLLYKAAQELLFNVVKHSGTSRATVSLVREATSLRLEVADRGKGFDPSAVLRPEYEVGGFGLLSLHERVALIGGSMAFDCAPGKGSRIGITIPFVGKPIPKNAGTKAAPAVPRSKVRPRRRG